MLIAPRPRPLRPAFLGASWLLPLTPAPDAEWIQAFAAYPWPAPLALSLQPPTIVCVDGTTGVGLRPAHVDGSITQIDQVLLVCRDAVGYANAVVDGHEPRSAMTRRNAQIVRRILRPERRDGLR